MEQPKKQDPNLLDENNLPKNLVAAPPQAPVGTTAPPMPHDMPPYFSGSISPAVQHDTSFVGTQIGSPRIPQFSLMPFGLQGNPTTNSAIESTVVKTSPSPTPSPAALDEILVNVQSGTAYTVQLSDRDTLISMTNNAGGIITLPGGSAKGFEFIQALQFTGAHTATTTTTNGKGNFLFLQVDTSDNGANPPTVSDTAGNSWVQITHVPNGGNTSVSYWYAANIKGGSNTITVTNFSSSVFCIAVLAEYQGVLPTSPLDQFLSEPQPGSGQIITTLSNEFVIFNASVSTGTAPVYGAAYTGRITTASNQVIQDKFAFTSGTVVPLSGQLTSFPASVESFFAASFRIAPPTVPVIFPLGWFCWIQNTGTGTFTVISAANIDSQDQSVMLGPNQGMLVVFDGFNWFTDRGIGTASLFYQIVQSLGVSKPQEAKLNFLTGFTVTDNPGNGSTDIGVSSFASAAVEINGVGTSLDKQFFMNGVTDGSTVWAVKINGTSDGG